MLVIDDDPNTHDLTDYYMSGVVLETLHAMSGCEGIQIAQRSLPDAILLDIDMPGMDGYQVCRQLKEIEITRDIPILFLTKDNESCHIAKALDFGGMDYVTKPFVPVELQARVRSALRVKQANDVLRKQSLIDPLTNLANRRAFDDGLQSAINNYSRNGHIFSLLILDLDHFKAVNDTHGHGIGDEVLTQVGKTFQRMSRPHDVSARYGGEEFRLILNQTELTDARNFGQRLLESIRQLAIPVGDCQLRITASIGLTCTSEHVEEVTTKQLFEQAVASLYEAKQQGRDRMVEHVAS
ncbi:MAG: diguanylate cyclase [Pirellulales bacterium]